ncbi:MAG: acetyl-CoA hydrolase [Eubacterium sp.]|nr:acetyl-CoA hydrolase [Eubacterium sp.]
MKDRIREMYTKKTMSPEDAVKIVKSGDTVFLGITSSTADALCDALEKRADQLEEVTLTSSHALGSSTLVSKLDKRAFRVVSCFLGPWERAAARMGSVDYTSIHLSQIDIWCSQVVPPDVAFLEVSPPDEEGYMSYGSSGVSFFDHIRESAKIIIVQINKNAPWVYGDRNKIHISQVDIVTEADRPLPTIDQNNADEAVQTISSHIIDQIPDGACIQLGLGNVSSTVGLGLGNKNDLGIHSELMTDSLMHLMKSGVVTNRYKRFKKWKSVTSFAYGTEELYRFIDHNKKMYFLPYTVVNDPVVIAKNDNFISINTAFCIDLYGQVCADNLAGKQFSGTGGQVDFVRGAQMSKGGKSFMAVTSTNTNKRGERQSKIVSQLPKGSLVTTTRSDVQYVVTEYGCVDLKPLTMGDRARALISLAHPDYREQLKEEAKALGILS